MALYISFLMKGRVCQMVDMIRIISETYRKDRNKARKLIEDNLEMFTPEIKKYNGKIPVAIMSGFIIALNYTKEYFTFNSDSFENMEKLNKLNYVCNLFK